jgi:phosphoglycolate phosphatase
MFLNNNVSEAMQCPICLKNDWRDYQYCNSCKTTTRHRAAFLYIKSLIGRNCLGPNSKILHIAPEAGIAQFLSGHFNYTAADINPHLNPVYADAQAVKLDLCEDAQSLPAKTYDLIIHNHILEHVCCNYTAVLIHLNNSLSSNGHILFTIPVISAGSYKEDIGNLSEAERQKAFFNKHHVRVFAEHDLSKTLGMVYDVSVERNQLVNNFSSEKLRFQLRVALEIVTINGAISANKLIGL